MTIIIGSLPPNGGENILTQAFTIPQGKMPHIHIVPYSRNHDEVVISAGEEEVCRIVNVFSIEFQE